MRIYGPGDYVPPVAISYWTFRIMIGAGTVMLLLAFYGLWKARDGVPENALYLKLMLWAIALPYIANSAGWIFTEIGRQPWIVFGLQKTADAVSPSVGSRRGSVLTHCLHPGLRRADGGRRGAAQEIRGRRGAR